MNILILTQYFPPEVGAPQNRLYELAIHLKKYGNSVTILTAMPNYPKRKIFPKYKGKLYIKEKMNGLFVFRTFIYVNKRNSILSRLLNYFSFVFSSLLWGIFSTNNFDLLVCESPPLFLGITAYILAKNNRARFVFNISDLWPESAEKLAIISNKFILRISTALEEFIYKKSTAISGQTMGIVNNVRYRFPKKRVYWLKNGVDLSYYDVHKCNNSWRKTQGFSENDFLLSYAGIIGHAQGLEIILKAASLITNYTQIKFLIIGDGPEKQTLLVEKESLGLKNVIFYDVQPKRKMLQIICSVDAAIIPLKKIDLFLGAIPSKIFENLALKKPILLGIDGEAKELFIKQGRCGLYFEPENSRDLVEKILYLYSHPHILRKLGENALDYVTRYFDRNIIAKEFNDFLRSIN